MSSMQQAAVGRPINLTTTSWIKHMRLSGDAVSKI